MFKNFAFACLYFKILNECVKAGFMKLVQEKHLKNQGSQRKIKKYIYFKFIDILFYTVKFVRYKTSKLMSYSLVQLFLFFLFDFKDELLRLNDKKRKFFPPPL